MWGENYLNDLYNLNKQLFIDFGVRNGNIVSWLKRNYSQYRSDGLEGGGDVNKDKELILAKHIIDAQIKLK